MAAAGDRPDAGKHEARDGGELAVPVGARVVEAVEQRLAMATREGAKALGVETSLGSIEPGKKADLILVDRNRPSLMLGPDPYSTLVYAARGTDVRATIVDGEVLVDDFRAVRWDPVDLARDARREAAALASRAGF